VWAVSESEIKEGSQNKFISALGSSFDIASDHRERGNLVRILKKLKS